jgi:hypothetical protein
MMMTSLPQDLLVLREQVDLFIADARDYFGFAKSYNLRNIAIKMVQIRHIHGFPLVYRLIDLRVCLERRNTK